jgi:hypothetical protein
MGLGGWELGWVGLVIVGWEGVVVTFVCLAFMFLSCGQHPLLVLSIVVVCFGSPSQEPPLGDASLLGRVA